MKRPVGSKCPYKKVICSFAGDCHDCPVFKEKERKILSREMN